MKGIAVALSWEAGLARHDALRYHPELCHPTHEKRKSGLGRVGSGAVAQHPVEESPKPVRAAAGGTCTDMPTLSVTRLDETGRNPA